MVVFIRLSHMLADYDNYLLSLGVDRGAFTNCRGCCGAGSFTVGVFPTTYREANRFLPTASPNVLTPSGDLSAKCHPSLGATNEADRCLVVVVTDWDTVFGGSIVSYEYLSLNVHAAPLSLSRISPSLAADKTSWSIRLGALYSELTNGRCEIVSTEISAVTVRLPAMSHLAPPNAPTSALESHSHVCGFPIALGSASSCPEKVAFHRHVGECMARLSAEKRNACDAAMLEVTRLSEALSDSQRARDALSASLAGEPSHSRGPRIDTAAHYPPPPAAVSPVPIPIPRVPAAHRGRGRGVRIGI